MQWNNVRLRPDGMLFVNTMQSDGLSFVSLLQTLCTQLYVPTDQHTLIFLQTERMWDAGGLPKGTPWELLSEVCNVLQVACKQGVTMNAIAALRNHVGIWDIITVWSIAEALGLRPEGKIGWYEYPPRESRIHEAMIFVLSPDGTTLHQYLGMMPQQGLTRYELDRLKKLQVKYAYGKLADGKVVQYVEENKTEFMRKPDGIWEYFPLTPWKDSNELNSVPWEQWKIILKSCAKRRQLNVNDLAVVVQTSACFTLHKHHCPELGTRPVYFFRKPNRSTATPREFWGFFSLDPDPNGATGISVRHDADGLGCLVSNSVAANLNVKSSSALVHGLEGPEISFTAHWATTRNSWSEKIQEELESRRPKFQTLFSEDQITWVDE
ncbi:hypothetical protein FRC07_003968 [Ceratobasidium sp. 392]|nr:hypothetical protein FRC07_003968 [Ceratobasidium sp. 392]